MSFNVYICVFSPLQYSIWSHILPPFSSLTTAGRPAPTRVDVGREGAVAAALLAVLRRALQDRPGWLQTIHCRAATGVRGRVKEAGRCAVLAFSGREVVRATGSCNRLLRVIPPAGRVSPQAKDNVRGVGRLGIVGPAARGRYLDGSARPRNLQRHAKAAQRRHRRRVPRRRRLPLAPLLVAVLARGGGPRAAQARARRDDRPSRRPRVSASHPSLRRPLRRPPRPRHPRATQDRASGHGRRRGRGAGGACLPELLHDPVGRSHRGTPSGRG